jgi:hypothetical protein
MQGLVDAGWIEVRPGSEDPAAVELMKKLSAKSRKRWPSALTGDAASPGVRPPAPEVANV